MSLKSSITTAMGRQLLQAQKHSPTLMLATGIVGFGASLVLTARASFKVGDILDKGKEELDAVGADESDENKKKRSRVQLSTAIEIAKLYAAPVVIGAVSVALVTGSHKTLSSRYAGVTAAYAGLDKAFRSYRERVAEELGAEKETQLFHDLEEVETYEIDEEGEQTPVKILKANKGRNLSMYAKFFDECNKNWRKEDFMNQFFIQSKEKYADDMLKARGHLFLSEVYDMLGYERTPASTQVGWIYQDQAQLEKKIGRLERELANLLKADSVKNADKIKDLREEIRVANLKLDLDSDNYVSFGIFRDPVIGQAWVNGDERSILLDFNVDGVIWDKI